MDFPTDWDVDEYKVDHESDEQWNMRRSFMVRWKNNFPEDRLVCLARVFTNIEFLDCRYPSEVMKLVAELSKEVAADYRTEKKKKLQRTFVSASDAAEDRAKGVKRPANEPAASRDPKGPKLFVAAQTSDKDHMNQQKTNERPSFQTSFQNEKTPFQSERPSFLSEKPSFQSERPSFQTSFQSQKPSFQSERPSFQTSFQSQKPSFRGERPFFESENPSFQSETPSSQYDRPSFQSGRPHFQNDRPSFQNQRPPFQQDMNNDNRRGDKNDRVQRNFQGRNEGNERGRNRRDRNQRNNQQYAVDDSIITSKYGRLVLFERPGATTHNLHGSCQQSKASFTAECEQTGDQTRCRVVINGIEVTSAVGPNQKEAKEAAYNEAWRILKRHCYTLQVLASHVSQEDKKISVNDVGTGDTSLEDGLDTRVDSAVATRIMKMMGWSGGGLGSTGDGIHEPIAPHLKQIRRAGLGSSASGSASAVEALRSTIEQFSREGDSNYDLVFANDFTKEERAEMHKIALRIGLKSKSYGKDDDRYIVISKRLQLSNLVRALLAVGGANDKHRLIPPSN